MINEVANTLDRWATDDAGPVAIHLKQRLLPVEAVNGEAGVIFPPTYADIGYNIDTLSDGTRVATIDSVGSQANRLEPIFRSESKEPGAWFVPQIEIVLRSESCGKCAACKKADSRTTKSDGCTAPRKVKRSVFDLAHRAADAVVQSSPGLNELVETAFKALQAGDAGPLCSLAPTSLVFGVWDSRGGSGEKRPRLVRSIIRAWDVDPLHGAAQYNSVWKDLDEGQKTGLEKEAKNQKAKLSAKGFADAPAVFRAGARVLGGVLARGRIEREITVNLVALRGLRGNDGKTDVIRKYLLGLSLMAATADTQLFLREGCHLRYADEEDVWYEVSRRGKPKAVSLPAGADLESYTREASKAFRPTWPSQTEYSFELSEAKKLLARKADEEAGGGA